MSQAFALSESILQSLYNTSDALPPLWEVIYQEGIRGHHLLFPAEVLRAWADSADAMEEAFDEADGERLTELVFGILNCHRLTDMQAVILTLDDRMMRVCFVLYLHALGWWQNHLRSDLLH